MCTVKDEREKMSRKEINAVKGMLAAQGVEHYKIVGRNDFSLGASAVWVTAGRVNMYFLFSDGEFVRCEID